MTYSTLLLSPLLPIKIAHYTFLEGTFLNFLVSKPQLREMVENHMEAQKEKARITMEVCRLTVDISQSIVNIFRIFRFWRSQGWAAER